MNGYQNPNYKTWDEWAKAAGVYDQFSAQQLAIAAEDPDFGWATTSNKVGYGAATTPEERAKYHQQQVNLNMTKGFTGGTDGSLYDLSPTQQAQNSAKDAVMGYGPFDYSRAPDYKSVMDKVINYSPFSYDYKTDPSYQAYAKQYAREGRRASEDTMGQYAAMTGGRPSTAAMTAAQQAGNYYSSQMADKIPELYQQAYQRYLQEYQRQIQALGALNTDRNFEYGVYGDRLGQLRDQYNLAAGENADALARVKDEEQTAYQRRIYDDETAYTREQDRLNRERQAVLDQYDMDQDEYERQLDAAKLGMNIGDYSKLEELGYTPDWNAVLNAELASQGRTVPIGSGSGGSRAAAAAEEEPPQYVDTYAAMQADGVQTAAQARDWLLQHGKSRTEAADMVADFAKMIEGTKEPARSQGYTAYDRELSAMDRRGATTEEIEAEVNAWQRDGKISEAEADDLLKAHPGQSVQGSGRQHKDGQPMSAAYGKTFTTVAGIRGTKGKKAALDKLNDMAGELHDYEIDMIMDELKLD